MKRYGRRKPYSEAGVKRLPCFRCGNKASAQWSICADGNLQRPICTTCDIDLNRMVLEWAGDPDAKAKIEAYKARENA